MESNNQQTSPKTIPHGVWESNEPKRNEKENKGSLTTDLQGNGYPTKKQDKQK